MKKFLLTLVTVFVLVSMISVDSAKAKKKGQKSQATSSHQICVEAGAQLRGRGKEIGFGRAFTYSYSFDNSLFLSTSVGYQSFGYDYKEDDILVPISIGFRYNFSTSGLKPYIGFEACLYVDPKSKGKIPFGIIPKVGIQYPLLSRLSIDANVKFNMFSKSGYDFIYFGVNLGIAYTI